LHRGTNGCDRGDGRGSAKGSGNLARRAFAAPDGKGAAIQSSALLPRGADVGLPAKVLLRAKTHGRWHEADSPVRPTWPKASNDSQTLAALEAAGAEHFASARSSHTGAEADFSGAFLAVRAKGGLHEIEPFKG
jgi:hypothetical protein